MRLLAMSASRSYLIAMAALAAVAVVGNTLGWSASVVQSESMEPHISTGDVVLAETLPDSSPIPIGGVITFHVEDRDVVHRVVAVNEDNSIVTAGDANHDDDPWSIVRDDITGRARLLVPYVGLPGLWMQRGEYLPLGAWLAVTTAALLLAAPARARRRKSPSSGAPSTSGMSAPAALVGAAAIAALVGLAAVAAPLAPVAASFTDHTAAAAAWKAKTYAPIILGGLAGYGALAATAVRDPDPHAYRSTVDGDVGTTPGTVVSGFRNKDVGSTNLDNESARNAMLAAEALRAALEERPITQTIPSSLAGTLTGGIYASSTGAFSIPGPLTLDARGDPSARFIFRTTSTLTMAQRARIVLVNGAQAANVYWVVGSTATLGDRITSSPDTAAVGTYLVAGDVALNGVLLTGRAVSFDAVVSVNGRIAPA